MRPPCVLLRAVRRRVEVACGSCTPHAMLLTALAQHLYHISMLLYQLECRAGPWGVVPKSRYVRRKHPLYTSSRSLFRRSDPFENLESARLIDPPLL